MSAIRVASVASPRYDPSVARRAKIVGKRVNKTPQAGRATPGEMFPDQSSLCRATRSHCLEEAKRRKPEAAYTISFFNNEARKLTRASKSPHFRKLATRGTKAARDIVSAIGRLRAVTRALEGEPPSFSRNVLLGTAADFFRQSDGFLKPWLTHAIFDVTILQYLLVVYDHAEGGAIGSEEGPPVWWTGRPTDEALAILAVLCGHWPSVPADKPWPKSEMTVRGAVWRIASTVRRARRARAARQI